LVLAALVLPAGAESVTIDSTNCTSGDGCYGLAWTLSITGGSFDGGAYAYQALLSVVDDPLVSGTPSIVISAVNFKVSSTVGDAELFSVPTSTLLGQWSTSLSNLSSGGCSGGGSGFVCSQASVAPTDPANFVASNVAQTWGWYFNADTPIFTGLDGAHIGAKLTDLSRPGQLLSAEYHVAVPEPGTLSMFVLGLAGFFGVRRRRLV